MATNVYFAICSDCMALLVRAMPHECRSAPAQHEIMTAPAVQSPNQPHRSRKLLRNVPTSAAFALDSRLCYPFPRVEGVIRRISV